MNILLHDYLKEKVGPDWSHYPKCCKFQLEVLRWRNPEKFKQIMNGPKLIDFKV